MGRGRGRYRKGFSGGCREHRPPCKGIQGLLKGLWGFAVFQKKRKGRFNLHPLGPLWD
jgi:hypothetical protein